MLSPREKRKRVAEQLFDETVQDETARENALAGLIVGAKVAPRAIFEEKVGRGAYRFSLADGDFEARLPALESELDTDELDLIEKAKAVYDYAILYGLMRGEKSIASAMAARIESGRPLPKSFAADPDAFIPQQLHHNELRKILEHLQKDYPSFGKVNPAEPASCNTRAKKIARLHSFRLPYYQGPRDTAKDASTWTDDEVVELARPWDLPVATSFARTEITYRDVDNLYCSPTIKRTIWQAVQILQELVAAQGGQAPAKIFLESTREASRAERGRANFSRQSRIMNIYRSLEDSEEAQQLMNELMSKTPHELQGKKWYLFLPRWGGAPTRASGLI